MNQYNENDEPHGYWKGIFTEVHYNNGVKQGNYKEYYDTEHKDLYCKGQYNNDEKTNMWKWYDEDGKSLYKKEFYL